ncbi:MAG: hypothetical protein EBS09_03095 [Flavobacteriia bacterium]|jgi:hypothetical protein|nr:hypothetical protein [Flavobacteriia bacterium]NBY39739.1 hypothetical protein [Flavobacteriia bacterium]
MIRIGTFICLLTLTGVFYAQNNDKLNSSGMLTIGIRSTLSAFNDQQNEMPGKGIGGHARLRLSKQINTDWFFDYITSDILNYAHRTDYHIGWSVLYYPLSELKCYRIQQTKYKPLFRPYVVAGHCFDYSLIQDKADINHFAERWSSAVQAGLGTHFEITPRFDVSLTAQYMFHLGNHIHIDYDFDTQVLEFHEEKGALQSGHLLINLSLNYKIAKLWGRK